MFQPALGPDAEALNGEAHLMVIVETTWLEPKYLLIVHLEPLDHVSLATVTPGEFRPHVPRLIQVAVPSLRMLEFCEGSQSSIILLRWSSGCYSYQGGVCALKLPPAK